MDVIDAFWYGAVTPGGVLENQDEKQKALARLIERKRINRIKRDFTSRKHLWQE